MRNSTTGLHWMRYCAMFSTTPHANTMPPVSSGPPKSCFIRARASPLKIRQNYRHACTVELTEYTPVKSALPVDPSGISVDNDLPVMVWKQLVDHIMTKIIARVTQLINLPKFLRTAPKVDYKPPSTKPCNVAGGVLERIGPCHIPESTYSPF